MADTQRDESQNDYRHRVDRRFSRPPWDGLVCDTVQPPAGHNRRSVRVHTARTSRFARQGTGRQ